MDAAVAYQLREGSGDASPECGDSLTTVHTVNLLAGIAGGLGYFLPADERPSPAELSPCEVTVGAAGSVKQDHTRAKLLDFRRNGRQFD
jgi:hypothetical protein